MESATSLFPTEVKETLEKLDSAFAIYQYYDGVIRVLVVSNGLIHLMEPGMTREKAVKRMEMNAEKHTHPDDQERVEAEIHSYIRGESNGLDIIYRKRLYGQDAYAMLHAKGSDQVINGQRIVLISFDDMTAVLDKESSVQGAYEKSLFQVVDNRVDAFAIINPDTFKIEISNQAMNTLLKKGHHNTVYFTNVFIDAKGQPIDLHNVIYHHGGIVSASGYDKDMILRVSAITWHHQPRLMIHLRPFDFYYYDAMTKLPNMTYLRSDSQSILNETFDRYAHPIVLFLDVRAMKGYNHTYGFTAGDRLLSDLARIIERTFPQDYVFKFSEDHFVVITGDDQLTERLRQVEKQIETAGRGLSTNVRGGICYLTKDVKDIMSACDQAKLACDAIKSEPNELFRIYDESLTRHAEIYDFVIEHFDDALKHHDIKVYYQPVIRTLTGQLCSLEALSRWDDPHYGMLNPGDFISALEETHQIVHLDLYVIKQICMDMRNAMNLGLSVVPVSFNLSRLDFITSDIFTEVERILAQYQIPRAMIYIEITESIIANSSYVRDQVTRFKDAGYQVWMDDFGSGYSSLNLLKDYDFDELKLDMVFMSSFTKRSKDIITSVVSMAKKIGIQTLAEGVETKEQFDFLKEIGCEKVQGYYFGKPMPRNTLREHLKHHQITIEKREETDYYRQAGAIELTKADALALLEKEAHGYRYLYYNNEYRQLAKQFGYSQSLEDYDALQNYFDSLKAQDSRDGTITTVSMKKGYMLFLNVRKVVSCKEKSIFELSIDAAYMDDRHHYIKALNSFVTEMVQLYDIVNIVHLNENYVDGFIEKGALFESGINRKQNVDAFRLSYAHRFVHPDDQKRYLDFVESHSLVNRIRDAKYGTISDRFRTYNEKNRRYEWKLYTELLLPRENQNIVMELIKTSIMEENENWKLG